MTHSTDGIDEQSSLLSSDEGKVEKRPWTEKLKSKYRDADGKYHWFSYGNNIVTGSAFATFFVNMGQAFLGPYELLLMATVLFTDFYRATRGARQAFYKEIGIPRALGEALVFAGAATAIIGGIVLGVGLITANSPFIFMGIMAYRMGQNLWEAKNKYALASAKRKDANLLEEGPEKEARLKEANNLKWEAREHLAVAALFLTIGVGIAFGFKVVYAGATVVAPFAMATAGLIGLHTLWNASKGPEKKNGNDDGLELSQTRSDESSPDVSSRHNAANKLIQDLEEEITVDQRRNTTTHGGQPNSLSSSAPGDNFRRSISSGSNGKLMAANSLLAPKRRTSQDAEDFLGNDDRDPLLGEQVRQRSK